MQNKIAAQMQLKEIRIVGYLSLLLWKRQLRAILLTEDVWKVINGDLDKPVHDDPTDKLFRRDLDKWKKLNNIALGWMLLTLEDYSRQTISKYRHPLDALRYLFKKYPPPHMTFEEFTDNDTPAPPTSAPTILIENANVANRPRPLAETNIAGISDADNLATNIVDTMELPITSRGLYSPINPQKQARMEAHSEAGRNPPNGIHEMVTHRELQTEGSVSTSGINTTRRNRFMEAILRPKASFSNLLEERANLATSRAEAARPATVEDKSDVPKRHADGPLLDSSLKEAKDTNIDVHVDARDPPSVSPTTEANIVVPERNVSLGHSDREHNGPGRRRRHARGAKSHDSVVGRSRYTMSRALQDKKHTYGAKSKKSVGEESPYMMSGALPDVSCYSPV